MDRGDISDLDALKESLEAGPGLNGLLPAFAVTLARLAAAERKAALANFAMEALHKMIPGRVQAAGDSVDSLVDEILSSKQFKDFAVVVAAHDELVKAIAKEREKALRVQLPPVPQAPPAPAFGSAELQAVAAALSDADSARNLARTKADVADFLAAAKFPGLTSAVLPFTTQPNASDKCYPFPERGGAVDPLRAFQERSGAAGPLECGSSYVVTGVPLPACAFAIRLGCELEKLCPTFKMGVKVVNDEVIIEGSPTSKLDPTTVRSPANLIQMLLSQQLRTPSSTLSTASKEQMQRAAALISVAVSAIFSEAIGDPNATSHEVDVAQRFTFFVACLVNGRFIEMPVGGVVPSVLYKLHREIMRDRDIAAANATAAQAAAAAAAQAAAAATAARAASSRAPARGTSREANVSGSKRHADHEPPRGDNGGSKKKPKIAAERSPDTKVPEYGVGCAVHMMHTVPGPCLVVGADGKITSEGTISRYLKESGLKLPMFGQTWNQANPKKPQG